MKKIMILNTLILASGLFGCNPKEILEPISFEKGIIDYIHGDTAIVKNKFEKYEFRKNNSKELDPSSIVVSDTIIKFKGVVMHGKPSKAPDLSKLKNTKDPIFKNKDIEYIALGSSLTAGVRDGGYFNEGILTAYPNLIARQLNIAKFESPVFDYLEYNGVGRKEFSKTNYTNTPLLKYNIVSNNTAVLDIESFNTNVGSFRTLKRPKLKQSSTKIENLHNLAVPNMHFERFTNTNDAQIEMPFMKRMSSSKKAEFKSNQDIYDALLERKFDFFTLEMGSQYFNIINTQINYYNDQFSFQGANSTFDQSMLPILAEKGIKGVISNLPNFYEFPHYKQLPCKLIAKNSYNVFSSEPCNDNLFIAPSSYSDSIASPNVGLSSKDRLLQGSKTVSPINIENLKRNIERFNSLVSANVKKNNYPILDLNSIYTKILTGVYVSDDGVKVDPKWPSGNFFSKDGIFPTAFGQAIIANEFIRTFNSFYLTTIPYIPTREYLNK